MAGPAPRAGAARGLLGRRGRIIHARGSHARPSKACSSDSFFFQSAGPAGGPLGRHFPRSTQGLPVQKNPRRPGRCRQGYAASCSECSCACSGEGRQAGQAVRSDRGQSGRRAKRVARRLAARLAPAAHGTPATTQAGEDDPLGRNPGPPHQGLQLLAVAGKPLSVLRLEPVPDCGGRGQSEARPQVSTGRLVHAAVWALEAAGGLAPRAGRGHVRRGIAHQRAGTPRATTR